MSEAVCNTVGGFVPSLTLLQVGIFLGFILIQPSDLTDFQTHLALLLDEFEFDISMPQLPQFDLSLVENEWRRLRSSIPEPWKLNNNGLEFTVGEAMAERGLSAKHPVVLIPGIISTVKCSHSSRRPFRCSSVLLCWQPGSGVLVYDTRVPAVLPSEDVGRVLYALTGHLQPR